MDVASVILLSPTVKLPALYVTLPLNPFPPHKKHWVGTPEPSTYEGCHNGIILLWKRADAPHSPAVQLHAPDSPFNATSFPCPIA